MLKKTLALILALLCAFSLFALTACNAEESAYELYTDGIKELLEAKTLDFNLTVNESMNMGGTSRQESAVMNIKTADDKVEITSDMLNIVYVDGIIYLAVSLGEESMKIKMSMSLEEAQEMMEEQAPDILGMFPEATEEDFKDVTVMTKDGKRSIMIDLPEDLIQDLTESVAGELAEGDSANLSDVSLTVSFDEDNHVTDAAFAAKMEITTMGVAVTADMGLIMEINSINGDISITAPADADEYEETDDEFSV